jgi:cobalt-zinc-cadmium efflux system membrane fusion protein
MVPQEVRKSLGIRKGEIEMIAVAQPPAEAQTLVLPGSTALDPTRLWRIRARFAPARVIEIAQVRDEAGSLAAGQTVLRELRSGDPVKKGDLLGVFFSPDVGNKKNDLIDALVQLKLDQDILDRSEKAVRTGALPEILLLTAQRNVNSDLNAIERAVSNLRTWDIPEEDIKAVYKEAEEISKRKGQRDREKDKVWPRVELRAPEDGTVVERNVAQHEMVVDNTINLFQIAKVDRLLVLANVPEDDLPTLQALSTRDRRWNVRTVGAGATPLHLPSPPAAGGEGRWRGGIDGPIDEIGYLIDPNQHTAIVKGYIDNPGGRIRAGQFVSATVKIPPPEGVVEVPIDAVVEDGQTCFVFVQTDPVQPHYILRRVQLTHRFEKTAFVRSTPIPKAEQRTPEEAELGVPPKEPLHPGERVLTTSVGELKATLLDMESKTQGKANQEKSN